MIEVRGEITADDYRHAMRLHARSRVVVRLAFTVGLTLYVLVIAAFLASGRAFDDPTTLPVLAAPVAVLVAVAFWVPRAQRRAFARQRTLQGEHRYLFSDDGLASESEHSKGELRWSAFIRWREDRTIVLLYQSDNLLMLLPKHWFEGDERRLDELRRLLQDHVG